MNGLLTVTQVAKMLNKNRVTIRRWIRKGRLPATQVTGGRGDPYYIKEEDLYRLFGGINDADTGQQAHAESEDKQ